MCERFHTMPSAGGMLDQDKLFMHVLQQTLVWKAEREELDQAQAKASAR